MGSPPLGPTLHYVTHHLNFFIIFPLGKAVIDGISIYLHFYAPSGEKMRVSNSSLFIFHQAQVEFQHHPYRDPDFPLPHNVLWAVLQSRHCIIMSFWKMVMWIVSKQELKGRVICPCLTVASQSALVRALCSGVLCGGASAVGQGDHSCLKCFQPRLVWLRG